MHHYFEAITNRSGDSLTGYFARVIDPANQNTVTLSSDNNGTPIVTVSGVENMAKTDENGNISLYVQPGTYHLDIYAPNATSFIMRVPNVAMNSTKGDKGDPGDGGSPGATGPANSSYASLAALKAAPPTNLSYTLATDTRKELYTFVAGDFTGRADDYNVVKLDAVPLSQGALKRVDGPLYAGNFGVVDDPTVATAGQIDQTAVAQAFLTLCNTHQRAANFGSLRVGTFGPLESFNVPILHDTLGSVLPQPGFWPRRRDGDARYWTLTMQGAAPASRISIRGYGEIVYNPDGTVASDTRPQVDGVLFGSDTDGTRPFFLSNVDTVIVFGLSGCGVKRATCWDCTFGTITVQRCGSDAARGGAYAFHDMADLSKSIDVNQTTTVRLQVEESCQRAIYVDPLTLSCTYSHIHSESASATAGVTTWVLGGPCTYHTPRLIALNAGVGTATFVGPTEVHELRAENGVQVSVDPQGAVANFHACMGAFRPVPNSNGRTNFWGCMGSWVRVQGGFFLQSCVIDTFEVALNPDPALTVVRDSRIATFRPFAGEPTTSVTLVNTIVDSGTLLRETIIDGGQFNIMGSSTTISDKIVRLRGGKLANGNITIATAALEASGAWRILGNITFGANRQSIFGPDGRVEGTVTNWGPPEAAQYLTHWRGMTTVHPAPADGAPSGYVCITGAAPGSPGTWRPLAAIATPAP